MEQISAQKRAIYTMLVAVGAVACGGTTPQANQARPHGKSSEMESQASSGPTVEQRRAVDAFAGDWLFHSTITLPDGKAIKADLAFSCGPTAGGRANVCSFGGEIPGMPPMEASMLIGADRLDGKVHFMAMTSDDELHDHVCAWQDEKKLVCDPLKGGLGGQAITEDLSFTFGDGALSFKSVIHMADGTQMVFDAPGTRVSAPAARGVSKPGEVSADQKKLVETFLGNWKWDANIAFPNGSSARAALDLQCQATAAGKASLCTLAAKDIAGRPFQASILVGHDPFDKSVHFMMMSSDDEVWHRTCAWKGDSVLACGSMRTGVMGMPVTSEVTFDFAGAQSSTRWSTDLGDGKTCVLMAQMSR